MVERTRKWVAAVPWEEWSEKHCPCLTRGHRTPLVEAMGLEVGC